MGRKAEQATEQVQAEAPETEHSAVVQFVVAKAQMRVLRRDINYLLRPLKDAIERDTTYKKAVAQRKAANATIASVKASAEAVLDNTNVKGTDVPIRKAVETLQDELKSWQAKKQAAEQSFETFAPEAQATIAGQ